MADKPPGTFVELLAEHTAPHGSKVFLPRRSADEHEPITFQRLLDDIDLLAAGLCSLGVRHGDRIGLLAENRYEWLLTDLAITSIGAIDVPRGSDTAPNEVVFILGHSGCRSAFVADDEAARALLARKVDLPALKDVITLQGSTGVEGVLTLTELLESGGRWLGEHPEGLSPLRGAVAPDDLLTIVYTSGTTADPKGVMLTHKNVLNNVRSTCEVLAITSDDRFLSVLPAWHMYERIMDYLALAAGAQLLYTDRRRLKTDLAKAGPTIFAAVPRIWEMIHDSLVGQATKMKGLRGKILRTVLSSCRHVGARRGGLQHRIVHGLFGRGIRRKILAEIAPCLRLAVTGGGALPRHVDECLLGLGIPILNGYGLTETSAVAAVRRPEANEPYTIGPPTPGTKIQARSTDGRVLAPGEVGVLWIHGPQIMKGYYQNPGKSAEVIDAEGWFNSGDLGQVRADGHVLITGRAKDTIVLAGGENVEPEPLETAIKTSPYIEQAVIVGQDRKALGALLVPQQDVLAEEIPRDKWGQFEGALLGEAVRALLRRELDRLLTRDNGFRPVERVTSFAVLTEPLTPENGLLTQTLKVRRHVVHERLGAVIDSLY